MEETKVVIVGAGPTGLALAAYLGMMNVECVILEKELEVTEDPRGIVLTGDAVRISYQLGLEEELTTKIGHIFKRLNFHHDSIKNAAFMFFDVEYDWAGQSCPGAIGQFQPNYERALRRLIESLSFCDLRSGCEVIDRIEEEDGSSLVKYKNKEGAEKSIRGTYLVGADGKRGIVRKIFLEPKGIKQEIGQYQYVATWVAANLKVTLPTTETHPNFPLWKLGYTPQQVYDVFWPEYFHFCNSAKRPAVFGQFGPLEQRLWRYEYSIEPEDEVNEDPEGHFWRVFAPAIVRPGQKFSYSLGGIDIEYPRDCVEVTRCRPFQFATQVVNRWYDANTLLIGDAAHVFPPFGGQGIAAGVKDAQALAWRLAMLLRLKSDSELSPPPAVQKRVFEGFAQERREQCDAATMHTKRNAEITVQRDWWRAFLHRSIMGILWMIPLMATWITRRLFTEKFQFEMFEDSCFDGTKGGGIKIPQVWVSNGEAPCLSDTVLFKDLSKLALVVLVRKKEVVDERAVRAIIASAKMPCGVLDTANVVYLGVDGKDQEMVLTSNKTESVYWICDEKVLVEERITPIRGYDALNVPKKVGQSAKYLIVRPDFYIHSVAKNEDELRSNLVEVANYFGKT